MTAPIDPRLPDWTLKSWPERLTQRLKELLTRLAIEVNQKVTVRKNGTRIGTRDKINFVEGSGVTLTVAEDIANDEIDVEIAASGGSGCCAVGYYESQYGVTLDNTSAQAEICTSDYVGFYVGTEVSQCSAIVDATVIVSLPPSTASATAETSLYLKAIDPTFYEHQISCRSTVKAPAYDDSHGRLTMAISLHGGVRLDGNWTEENSGDWVFVVCGDPTSMSLSAVVVESVCMRWFKIPCSYEPT